MRSSFLDEFPYDPGEGNGVLSLDPVLRTLDIHNATIGEEAGYLPRPLDGKLRAVGSAGKEDRAGDAAARSPVSCKRWLAPPHRQVEQLHSITPENTFSHFCCNR